MSVPKGIIHVMKKILFFNFQKKFTIVNEDCVIVTDLEIRIQIIDLGSFQKFCLNS